MRHRHCFPSPLLGINCFINLGLKYFFLNQNKKRCKFPLKCKPYLGYMKINSNDQLDLKGSCLSKCDGISIAYSFSIFTLDSTLNTWTPFTNNLYFFTTGLSNSYLVVFKDLFRDYSSQVIWKIQSNIELITFANETLSASTSMIVYVNYSPRNGVCMASPISGTTNTLFSINCNNWIDTDGSVVSYSYYGKQKIS